jgi:hypothetical protein
LRTSAIAGIFALTVLADDEPVQSAGCEVAQGAADTRKDAGRPDIGVLVEALADRQAQAPQRDVIRDVGGADGAKQNGILFAQLRQPILRHEGAGAAIALAAPVKALDVKGKPAIGFAQCLQHLQSGFDHFRANAIGPDGCNFVSPNCHSTKLRHALI